MPGRRLLILRLETSFYDGNLVYVLLRCGEARALKVDVDVRSFVEVG